MNGQKYLAHIDGIRAIAVISVILYHLNSNLIPGGFLGVDIFFVLSGYLITNIVYHRKLENSFSYIDFYCRRIKRIIPALYFTLILTLIGSYIFLLPYDLYKVGISSLSTILFLANYQFALRRGDYFSGNAEEWPLLHTWSLSVEEQYYFILPIILLILVNKDKKNLIFTLLSIIVIATIFTEFASRSVTLKSFSYYGLPTRIQELMYGSLAAILTYRKNYELKSQTLSIISLAVITLILSLFKSKYIFPSIIVLPLSIAVVMLIYSRETLVNKILEIPPIIFIGKLSYSLYLIHWPVMAFSRYIFNVTDVNYKFTILQSIMVLIITFLLSCFSYFIVERPLRYKKVSQKKIIISYFILPTIILGTISTYIVQTNGIPFRLDSNKILATERFFHIDKTKCPNLVNAGCTAGNESSRTKTVYLYGNSHAEHYFEFLTKLVENKNYKVKLFAAGGCGVESKAKKCNYFRDKFYSEIDSDSIIFISYRYDNIYEKTKTLDATYDEIERISKITDKVVVLAQPPKLIYEPLKIYNCNRLKFKCPSRNEITEDFPEYNLKIQKMISDLNVVMFDPFSQNTRLSEEFAADNKRYSDNDHLSVYGSKVLAEYVLNNDIKIPFIM